MSIESKFVLVKRSTRLDDLITRFNTIGQAKFYIEHLGADFDDYQIEHNNYYSSLNLAKNILSNHAKLHVLDRKYLPNYIFGPSDIVIALGQDGLVANTLKYLTSQPLIGVNPDPKRYDGVLLPFKPGDLNLLSKELLDNKRKFKDVTIAKAALNDGQKILAVNDFFIGQKTHTSARYTITYNNQSEFHSSSGIIISTGLGSTGWLKSILAGSFGIAGSFSNKSKSNNIKKNGSLSKDKKSGASIPEADWSSDKLYFSVREPFPSNVTQTNIIFGEIHPGLSLKIVSQMPENGIIFSDGIEADFINFNSGIEAEITIADHKGKLVI